MPNAQLRAVDACLPTPDRQIPKFEPTDHFHVRVGQDIARIASDREQREAELGSLPDDAKMDRNYLERAIDHLYDRERALVTALSAVEARSLADAAIQLAAASRLFNTLTVNAEPDEEAERAIERLLHSGTTVLVEAAKLDRHSDGIQALFPTQMDEWSDVCDRLAAARQAVAAVSA